MFDFKWTHVSYLLLFVSLAFFATGPAAACGAEDAVKVLPDESYFGPAGGAGETFCYRIDLDSAGVLIVGAAAPGAAAEPKLRVAEHRGAAAGIAVAGSGAARLVLWAAEPGVYVFEVAMEDRRNELGEHVFSSRFVSDAAEVADVGPRTKDGEDGEIDPILVTAPAPGGSAARRPVPGLLLFDAGRQYFVRFAGGSVRGSRAIALEILP